MREQRRQKEEFQQTKIHNNLNGLEKYSLIFGDHLNGLEEIYMYNVHVHSRDMDAYPTANIQPETKNNPFSTLLERK